MLAQECNVLFVLDFIADDADLNVMVACVFLVLAVHRNAFAGRFSHQKGDVEASEQPRGKRVRPRSHVHDDVLVWAVDDMIEVELGGTDLAVVARKTEVVLCEWAGNHEGGSCDRTTEFLVERIISVYLEQARAASGGRGLQYAFGGRDARIVASQEVFELEHVETERQRGRRLVFGETEGHTEMLVDVGIDGNGRKAKASQVTNEQRAGRCLTTTTLADKGDLHDCLLLLLSGHIKRRKLSYDSKYLNAILLHLLYTTCYMDDEALLRKILGSNRQKITGPRLEIFRMLRGSEPQAVGSLIAASKGKIDRVTIYRVLDLYEKLGITKRITVGWKYKVELSDVFLDHHHHATCVDCGKVMEIVENNELETLIEKLSSQSGLAMTSHILEVQGYCQKCDARRLRQ